METAGKRPCFLAPFQIKCAAGMLNNQKQTSDSSKLFQKRSISFLGFPCGVEAEQVVSSPGKR